MWGRKNAEIKDLTEMNQTAFATRDEAVAQLQETNARYLAEHADHSRTKRLLKRSDDTVNKVAERMDLIALLADSSFHVHHVLIEGVPFFMVHQH